MSSHNVRQVRCPECLTTHIKTLKRSGIMRCKDCGAGFDREAAVRAAERWKRQRPMRVSAGSGQIAGPAYHRGLRWGSYVPG